MGKAMARRTAHIVRANRQRPRGAGVVDSSGEGGGVDCVSDAVMAISLPVCSLRAILLKDDPGSGLLISVEDSYHSRLGSGPVGWQSSCLKEADGKRLW